MKTIPNEMTERGEAAIVRASVEGTHNGPMRNRVQLILEEALRGYEIAPFELSEDERVALRDGAYPPALGAALARAQRVLVPRHVSSVSATCVECSAVTAFHTRSATYPAYVVCSACFVSGRWRAKTAEQQAAVSQLAESKIAKQEAKSSAYTPWMTLHDLLGDSWRAASGTPPREGALMLADLVSFFDAYESALRHTGHESKACANFREVLREVLLDWRAFLMPVVNTMFAEGVQLAQRVIELESQLSERQAARAQVQQLIIGERNPQPVPMLLTCPRCFEQHVDKGVWATKPHHTHACQQCGLCWRPAVTWTTGVQFLPGFKDEEGGANV